MDKEWIDDIKYEHTLPESIPFDIYDTKMYAFWKWNYICIILYVLDTMQYICLWSAKQKHAAKYFKKIYDSKPLTYFGSIYLYAVRSVYVVVYIDLLTKA